MLYYQNASAKQLAVFHLPTELVLTNNHQLDEGAKNNVKL
jgi:hypothetical protein